MSISEMCKQSIRLHQGLNGHSYPVEPDMELMRRKFLGTPIKFRKDRTYGSDFGPSHSFHCDTRKKPLKYFI